MSLDQLWAGWRSNYVASMGASHLDDLDPEARKEADAPAECVFCRIIGSTESDESRHVVATTERCVVLLNAYPYASGHVLVLPRRHIEDLGDLDGPESSELWETTTTAAAVLRAAYDPDGINLGANLGRAAGAGIPAHLHLHLVPRWSGDTNFMTSIASVRVLPEALGDTWAKLRAAWPT